MEVTPRRFPSDSVKENVVERFFQLPVVSSTVDNLQNKYINMKEAHPLVGSFCSFFEKVHTAGLLVVNSIQPVMKMFQHQISAANDVACKGMDHLEHKIPALYCHPHMIAFEMKQSISATIQHAKSGIGSPITNTSGKVFGMASAGFDLTFNTINGATDYACSTRLSHMAREAVDLAICGMERLVDCWFSQQGQPNEFDQSLPQTDTLPRIGALANKVFKHTSQWAFRTIEESKNVGEKLTAWLPRLVTM
ncbi:hypothetical protein GDO86_006409, partial [Hymenochirus boettgeri]